MRLSLRSCWPYLKAFLAVVVIAAVGWQFARTLRSPELWESSLQPQPHWLLLAALLYMFAFTFPWLFWHHLLRVVGSPAPATASARAYFIAHLGKYVPGKMLALVLRAGLMRDTGVSAGVAALTATYETFILMASGAALAVGLFSLQALQTDDLWKALLVLVLVGVPVLPGVCNRLVARATRRFLTNPPQLSARTLLTGLALTACAWPLMGLSLAAVLYALVPETQSWDLQVWARHTAYVALAYVAGFVVIFTPGGLGSREYVLQKLLALELAAALPAEQATAIAVVVVLIVRLVWTGSEVILAAAAWFLPAPVGRQGPAVVEQTNDPVPPPLLPTTDAQP
jgi:uncharacterized membrane protein YbhN (UPF0104 family)